MNNESQPKLNNDKPTKRGLLKKFWLYSFAVFTITLTLDLLRVGFVNGNAPLWITLPLIISALIFFVCFPTWFIVWLHSKKRIWKLIKIAAISIGILIFLLILWVIFFRYAIVDGASMEPSYKNGDVYLVSKFAYKSTDPKRGDVIDYSLPENGGERVGRIVGLPNETIQLKPDMILVDEKQIDEPYVDWSKWAENREQNISPKDNEYLVLFDKRGGNIQLVNKKDIIGKFIFKLK